MPKYYARITRDIVRTISMGALVVHSVRTGEEREIAPPRVHLLPSKAGSVSVHATARARDAYIAAVNSEHPGAAVREV